MSHVERMGEGCNHTNDHNDWLTKEINKAHEKMEEGKTEFHSSESAEQMMALRKERAKSKPQKKKTKRK